MRRIFVRNSSGNIPNDLFTEVTSVIHEEELFDEDSPYYIGRLRDVCLLGYGYKYWQEIRERHNEGVIHIGLRNFNYNDIVDDNFHFLTLRNNLRIMLGARFMGEDDINLKIFQSDEIYKKSRPCPPKQILDLSEFTEEIKLLLLGDGMFIGFDYETHGFPMNPDYFPLGASFVTRHYGYYIDCRDYRDYADPVWDQFRDLVENYNDRLVVFNNNFEAACNMHQWGIFRELPDAWAVAKAAGFKRGLKLASQRFNYSMTWDDDLDEELKAYIALWKDFESFAEAKAYIKEDKIGFKMDHPLIWKLWSTDKNHRKRAQEEWGYEWYCVDPVKLGLYCIDDSHETLMMWEVLHGKYPNAELTFLMNSWYGNLFQFFGPFVNIPLAEKLFEYYEGIMVHSQQYFNLLYYESLNQLYGKEIHELDVTSIMPIVKIDPNLLAETPGKLAKGIIRHFFDEETEIFDRDLFQRTIDPEIFEFFEDFVEFEDIDKKTFRKRKCFEEIGEFVYELYSVERVIRTINKLNIDRIMPLIKEYNAHTRKMTKMEKPSEYMPIVEYVDSGYSFQRTLEDGYELTEKDFYKVANLSEYKYRLLKGYISQEVYREMLLSFNFKDYLPEEIVVQMNQNVYTVQDLCLLLQFEAHKDELLKVKTMKLTDPIPSEKYKELAEGIINWNADKQCWDFLLKYLSSDLAQGHLTSREFLDYYYNEEIEKPDLSDAEMLSWFQDGFVHSELYQQRIAEYTGNVLKFSRTKIKKGEADDYLKMSNLDKFFYLESFVDEIDHELNRDSKLDIPDNRLELAMKIAQVWSIFKVSQKASSTYVAGFLYDSVEVKEHLGDQHAEIVNKEESGSSYQIRYMVNMKKSGRWAGSIHTVPPKADASVILQAEAEDKILVYFDISSGEPSFNNYQAGCREFTDNYEKGFDPYISLARDYYPEETDEQIRGRRGDFKVVTLATSYGMGLNSLAGFLYVDIEDAEKLTEFYFQKYKELGQYIKYKSDFCVENNGLVESAFGYYLMGDKDNAERHGINLSTQGGFSISTASGFYNVVKTGWDLGFEIKPRAVVHDSSTNQIPTSDLLFYDKLCRRFYQEWCKEYYGCFFRYDLDINRNWRDHTGYSWDYDTNIIKLKGYTQDVDVILKHLLPEWKMDILSSEVKGEPKDLIKSNSRIYDKRKHIFCEYPEVYRYETKSVELKLREMTKEQNEKFELIQRTPLFHRGEKRIPLWHERMDKENPNWREELQIVKLKKH